VTPVPAVDRGPRGRAAFADRSRVVAQPIVRDTRSREEPRDEDRDTGSAGSLGTGT